MVPFPGLLLSIFVVGPQSSGTVKVSVIPQAEVATLFVKSGLPPKFAPDNSDRKFGLFRQERSGWFYFQEGNRPVYRFDPRIPSLYKFTVSEMVAKEVGKDWVPYKVLSTGLLSRAAREGIENLARDTDPVLVPGSLASGKVSFLPQPAIEFNLTSAGRTVSHEAGIGMFSALGKDEARKRYAEADKSPAALYAPDSAEIKRMLSSGLEESPDGVKIRFFGMRARQDRAVEIAEAGRYLRQLNEALKQDFEQRNAELLKSVRDALGFMFDKSGNLTPEAKRNIVRSFEENFSAYGFGSKAEAGDFARKSTVTGMSPALNIIFPVGDASGYDGLRLFP